MRHLNALTRPFTRQRINGHTFHVDPTHAGDLHQVVQRFLAAPDQHQTLDIPEATRGVYLLQGERKWVLKYNRLEHWKKRLQNYLGLKRTYGLHDLTNEFINLSVTGRKSALVPKVAAFGYTARFPLLRDEYLLIEYLDDHSNVDERLIAHPECASALLPQVFGLFSQMLADGFVHMDPHPKNILISPQGELRLIDFECCAHTVIDRDFSLGFLMGYFYHYWVQRYVPLEDYRRACQAYLDAEQPGLDKAVFGPVFERFLTTKVSRTTRYSILTCAQAQQAFKATLQG
ncbi:Unusual protein kinase [Pseudomonas reidholzensis]|uniref:Unusual protein kinase n=1 Tax=Pseudomonas reidholzensis TaxID=1785162 RepID=A0A383RRE3_9PSED|nr:lipopolysaccharide kinase InaA family protein [Pseudomonas reidholzensis]SYX89455.1 Unusual protein kinase [Pseudomonas reidholzensis]